MLRLVGDAVVHHSHRESLRDLYRQYRRYGQSDVLLGKKHGASWPHTIVKVVVDGLRVLLAPVLSLILLPFAALVGDGVIAAGPLLRAVRVVARRVGQVKALLRPARLHRA